ncbi:MAG: SMI1/KNR4 family protein [Bacteroidota bacterium]|nr:SMI1/KNR4 family protein [Bacteroidota bacterium]
MVKSQWIKEVEAELDFALPKSYVWAMTEYQFIDFKGFGEVKSIAPPEFREVADSDILYTYKVNIENGFLKSNQLSLLESDEEFYYFLVEPNLDDNEYKVYKRDLYLAEDVLFADNFTDFVEKIIAFL